MGSGGAGCGGRLNFQKFLLMELNYWQDVIQKFPNHSKSVNKTVKINWGGKPEISQIQGGGGGNLATIAK